MMRSSSRSSRTRANSACAMRLWVAYQPGCRLLYVIFTLSSRSAVIQPAWFDSTTARALLYRWQTNWMRTAKRSGDSRPDQTATSRRSLLSNTVSAAGSPTLPKPVGSAYTSYSRPSMGASNSPQPWLPSVGSSRAVSSRVRSTSSGIIGRWLPIQPSYGSDGYFALNSRVSPTNSERSRVRMK